LKYEEANPNPEFLIKSIAEQGYSLETALADLIDNSISAGADKIDIIVSLSSEPFALYVADNGCGMDKATLRKSMEFPSESPESKRREEDLGRFGLGMKTASFSQTRNFSVYTRENGNGPYFGRTWDVERLKKRGKWEMGIHSKADISEAIKEYADISSSYLNEFDQFESNTIVTWRGLYKYENYLDSEAKKTALKKQLEETTCDHLSLVFHRFLERNSGAIQIRVNNKILRPFNPFPSSKYGVRKIEPRQKSFRAEFIKIEGFVLPSSSIDESKNSISRWTTRNRGLMDMEGIYVYRADRIILFGGWNGLIRKGPRLQLARMRLEVGNSIDHLLHLNVSKSQIVIPHDLRPGFESYITELRAEAEREYYNRGINRVEGDVAAEKQQLFTKVPSNRGIQLELNPEFPLIEGLWANLPKDHRKLLMLLVRMINTAMNKLRRTHEDKVFVETNSEETLSTIDIIEVLKKLLDGGMTKDGIKKNVLPGLGYTEESMPVEIIEFLK
jgi:hypothetical protein